MPPYIAKDAVALLAKIPAIPIIPAPYGDVLLKLNARLRTLIDRSVSDSAKLLSVLKYATYIVLLLNVGSLPFVWHIRVFWPIFAPRLDYWLLYLKVFFASKKERRRALIAWAEDLSPAGANPFDISTIYRRWATLDDCDMFGMHLSNSSYAKAFDTARAKALVQCFPAWGRSGGQMALGATHYHFIREIAPFAKYEVRLTIGSWDHKWLYIVARYVTLPSRHRRASYTPPPSSTPPTPSNGAARQNGSAHVERAVAAAIQADTPGPGAHRRPPIVEPDGATLHCVAVSQICFKAGRITIPPAVVLASEGFTKPCEEGNGDSLHMARTSPHVRAYSRTNPPPNWVQSQALRLPPHGSMENFRAFLRGTWRNVPEGERWWEDALGGSVETKRQANLEILESLKLGMELTRTLR